MDASLLMWAGLGALAGFAASLLPGLHVNALALAWLVWAPSSGLGGVAFLVAALVASPFGLALPSTFLGASSEESALVSLPAHALAREGRGVEAVARQVWGAAMGILVAVAVVPLARPLLTWGSPHLARSLPWLILGILVLLVVTEPRRLPVHARVLVLPHGVPGGRRVVGVLWRDEEGHVVHIGGRRIFDPLDVLSQTPSGASVAVRVERASRHGPLSGAAGRAAAVVALALSGVLGLAALPLGASSPFGLPASPLLPLLAGLFAGPVLWDGLQASRGRGAPSWGRAPFVAAWKLLSLAAPGALASALLGIVPGVSASHAALLTPRRDAPEEALVTLGAVNGGAVVFTLLAWHALDKARSGVLVAAGSLVRPTAWRTVAPPGAILDEGIVVLVAVLIGLVLARCLSVPMARWVGRHSPSRFAWAGVAILTTMVFVSTGALGLLELAVATLCGRVIARLGVRRGLAMGVILVPSLLRAWGSV